MIFNVVSMPTEQWTEVHKPRLILDVSVWDWAGFYKQIYSTVCLSQIYWKSTDSGTENYILKATYFCFEKLPVNAEIVESMDIFS